MRVGIINLEICGNNVNLYKLENFLVSLKFEEAKQDTELGGCHKSII